MLDAMRRHVVRLGYRSMMAPVRPNGKHAHPQLPMTEYAAWRREDGTPADPLAAGTRAGRGQMRWVAQRSMTIPGALAEWRQWTGLPFDASGPFQVPLALAPMHGDLTHDHAVYVEPNVWVHHCLTRAGRPGRLAASACARRQIRVPHVTGAWSTQMARPGVDGQSTCAFQTFVS